MKQLVIPLLILAGSLVACGSPDPIDRDDPFASLHPWDPDRRGLTRTDTGLEIVEIDNGPANGLTPAQDDLVLVHYEGRITSTGERFESSYETGRPSLFGAAGRFGGWSQAIREMSEGDDWMVNMPSDLLRGLRSFQPTIQPEDEVLYRIELLKVLKLQSVDEAAWQRHLPWDSADPEIIKTDTGLEYIILEPGNASDQPLSEESRFLVHYDGRFADTGQPFDSSFDQIEPFQAGLSGIIQGWIDILPRLSEGERVLVFIPSELAYGSRGFSNLIPGDADLVFQMKLMAIITPTN